MRDAPQRVEILISYPGATGPVVGVSQPGAAQQTQLEWRIVVGDTGLVPNTTVSARWRITTASGEAFVGPSAKVTYADTRFDWKTKDGSLVRLHWYEGSDAFATHALDIAERGVKKAADVLGVQETDPIDFYVYADQQAFLAAMGPGTHEFVIGRAYADIRTMFACIGSGCPSSSDAEVARTVPHELTHLVFDTATHNLYHVPPHWLNEGLATYLSEGYAVSYRADVENAVRSGTLIPLPAIAGNFPSTYDKAILSYGEGTSAVDFAIRTFGQDAFVAMVRSYAAGRTDDEAFSEAFGVDTAGFEKAWLADLGATEPRQYGPQPAPANPAFPPVGRAVRHRPRGPREPARRPARSRSAASLPRRRRTRRTSAAGVTPSGVTAASDGGLGVLPIVIVVLVGLLAASSPSSWCIAGPGRLLRHRDPAGSSTSPASGCASSRRDSAAGTATAVLAAAIRAAGCLAAAGSADVAAPPVAGSTMPGSRRAVAVGAAGPPRGSAEPGPPPWQQPASVAVAARPAGAARAAPAPGWPAVARPSAPTPAAALAAGQAGRPRGQPVEPPPWQATTQPEPSPVAAGQDLPTTVRDRSAPGSARTPRAPCEHTPRPTEQTPRPWQRPPRRQLLWSIRRAPVRPRRRSTSAMTRPGANRPPA